MDGLYPYIKDLIRQSLVNKCHAILLEGHRLMKDTGIGPLQELEEDAITANLVKYMNLTPEARSSSFNITAQHPLYSEAVLGGTVSPKESPVVDIRFFTWGQDKEFEYFIEAKNVSERDWSKSSGSRVSAAYYRKRYISTGIDHFVQSYYPEGCLAGYVVNGTTDRVVAGINRVLQRDARKTEMLKASDEPPGCYYSEHKTGSEWLLLLHFMLDMKS